MYHANKSLLVPAKTRLLSFKTSERLNAHRIQLILDYVAANYSLDISIVQMSRIINLSPSRFSHLFKAHRGISPMRYVKLVRLQRASELLHTTCMNIKEVMFQVGLADASHFVRDFRRLYGLTPGHHRAKLLLDAVSEVPSADYLVHAGRSTIKANK